MNKVLSTKIFIVAQALILVLGLIFLGGLYFILNSEQYNKTPLQNYRPVTREPVSFNLEITNPDDEILVFDKSLIVSGRTSSKATIIISNLDQNMGLQADSNGEFSKVVDLTNGENEIEIAAFDENGNTKSFSRTIFYSEEKI